MPNQLLDGYIRFKNGYLIEHKSELSLLAEEQRPRIAIVSCCDSRVDPTIIFDSRPGELFVIRNVANLVPLYNEEDKLKCTSSALEFAILGLNVEHIVVLGHANCGGIRALMSDPHESDSFKFLYSWVSIAQPIKNRIIEEYVSKADRFVACEKASIVQSLDNLKTFPWIKERVESERLWLHGWYYDLTSGKLLIYSPEQKKFETFRH